MRAYSILLRTPDDRVLDLLEAVLEEHRSERCLQQSGEHVAVARKAIELFLRHRDRALRHALSELELAGDHSATRTRHHVRADLRQLSLGEVRIPLVQLPRDGELEHAVAQDLETPVRRGTVRRPRGVGEDVLQPLGGQVVDQALEACVTGAT